MNARLLVLAVASVSFLLSSTEAGGRRPPPPTPLPELSDESSGQPQAPAKPLMLWYDRPGSNYHTDLPFGNGRIGGMVNGGVSIERIWLNEDSVWAGGPGELKEVDDEITEEVAKGIAEARKLMFQDKVADGQNKLFSSLRGGGGGGVGCSQVLGMLDLHFAEKSLVNNYRRDLDLDEAIVRVQYLKDGILFKREVFASRPDQVIVSRLEADKPGNTSFTAKLGRGQGAETKAEEEDSLVMLGSIGMKFIARVKVIPDGGEVSAKGNDLVVHGADAATILISLATDYLPKPPTFRGNAYEDISARQIEAASEKTYSRLKTVHIEAHRKQFRRMTIDLGRSTATKRSQATDVRVANFSRDEDPELQALLFQYGRYLLISCSQPGSQPANLQGLWIGNFKPMWNGDYHLDVNIQMAYWLAGPCTIAECMLPVADLVEWTIPCAPMHRSSTCGRIMICSGRKARVSDATNSAGGRPPGPKPGKNMVRMQPLKMRSRLTGRCTGRNRAAMLISRLVCFT